MSAPPPPQEPPAPPLGLAFDPTSEGVPPKDAATVIPVRQADGGAEIFGVVRNPRSGFLGGALVFPGGKVDPSDASVALGFVETDALRILAEAPEKMRALLVAALRESLEEVGLMPVAADAGAIAAARQALAGGQPFAEIVARLAPRVDALVPFARWVTPRAEARRFDARFFLMSADDCPAPSVDGHETVAGDWATAGAWIERFHAGAVQLAPPTLRVLELLAPCRTVTEALALARDQSLLPICPEFVAGDPPMLTLPGDPLHPIRERRVAGSTRFALLDGRFQSVDP
jgi:8-oxo-dGTP pyrophosphatase MutT (NUDIX family)